MTAPGAIPVLVAVTGPAEAPLVTGLERVASEVTVVRRCADLAELLAAAESGLARAAVVSTDLPRLDRDALARLAACGVAVVGLLDGAGSAPAAGGAATEYRLRGLGMHRVLPTGSTPDEVAAQLLAAVEAARVGALPAEAATPGRSGRDVRGQPAPGATGPAVRPSVMPVSRLVADPADALTPLPRLPVVGGGAEPRPAGGRGRVVAVWGPTGAPGRTTVAVGLAAEAAALGLSTIIADADTYGPCVAQALGLVHESAGLAAAVRAAGQGTLDPPRLARLTPVAAPNLRVLSGLVRAARWPELRPAGLDAVWETGRAVADWTFVDCGFALEADEELSFDTAAPRRNAATLSALAAADTVVAVGAADPVGLQRLILGLQELADLRGPAAAPPVVVVNRVRASAVGPRPERRVRDMLARFGGVRGALTVPEDRAALDEALLLGRTLVECAPASPARQSLVALAATLGVTAPSMSR